MHILLHLSLDFVSPLESYVCVCVGGENCVCEFRIFHVIFTIKQLAFYKFILQKVIHQNATEIHQCTTPKIN